MKKLICYLALSTSGTAAILNYGLKQINWK